ncbi:MAG: hypothetical protein QM504_12315 [Pseudomonadota bacterium]
MDAKKNLADFIIFAKKLPPLNEDMKYDSAYWKKAVNFTKIGVSSKNRELEKQLDKTIMPFAKAYLIYSQTHNRAKTFNEMKALRAVEKVMLKSHGKVDILKINSIILDQAAQVIREEYSPQAAYHGGIHLVKLQKHLVDKKIIKSFTWKNPINRGEDTIERVGNEGAKNREKKLPDENALLALADIFVLGESQLSPRDILLSSSIPILLAAPARGSELFYLKADCLHEDTDRNGKKVLGIKWYSGKGYGFEVEWVPEVMEETVREAVRRLQVLSSEARAFAFHLESSQNEQMINVQSTGFPYINFDTGEEVKVKWGDGLFSLFSFQLSDKYKTNKKKLWMPHIDTLNEDLAKTKKKRKNSDELVNVLSIFERHNYPSSYKIKSHQIRHLLTTLAKVNGMETELLTKWSKRADFKHNRIYNHATPEQYNKLNTLIKGGGQGSELNLCNIELISAETIQEININTSLTAHQTEFGACIHDYIMSPCSKHRNCISCTEHVCMKGDDVRLARIKKLLAREELLLEYDKNSMDDGIIGADRHYNKRLETIENCRSLISVLTNDNIPDGSYVKLSSDKAISHLDIALDINYKKRLPKIEKTSKNGVETIRRPPKALGKLNMLRGIK